MNYLRQSLFGLVVVGFLCAIGMSVLIRSHIDTINGGRVAVVDSTPFETEAVLTAIQNVNVLSPAGDAFLDDRTVVISDGRILTINEDDAAPDGARVIDGRGRFLIPGLIDANVDLRRQPNDLLLYLANGVTHVRDLSGRAQDLALKQELEDNRVGPSLTVASPKLHSAGFIEGGWIAMTRPAVNVRSSDRASGVVEELAKAGYDAISVDSAVEIDTFKAIIAAAEAVGLSTIGHLPDRFDLAELSSMTLTELARIENLIERLLDEFSLQNDGGGRAAFLDFVQQRAPQIADDLLTSGTAVSSSLWLMDTLARQAGDLVSALRNLPLEYANPAMVEGSPYAGVGWLPGMNRFELPRDLDAERRDSTIAIWQTRNQAQKIVLRELAARGVPITASSNATAELMIPGFSLHDELRILHQSGLSPAQTLQTATRVPAGLMGLRSGVIEADRPADLVLLRDNPLIDITNTRSIDAVIRDGQTYKRADLDAMLEAVRQAHAKSRKFELSRYQ